MIYELRVYQIQPGKMPSFNEKFGRLIMPLFEKTGIKVIGVWQTSIGNSNEFTYMVAFNSMAEREEKWAKALSDETFRKYREEDAREGPHVTNINNKILRPTDYSPLK